LLHAFQAALMLPRSESWCFQAHVSPQDQVPAYQFHILHERVWLQPGNLPIAMGGTVTPPILISGAELILRRADSLDVDKSTDERAANVGKAINAPFVK